MLMGTRGCLQVIESGVGVLTNFPAGCRGEKQEERKATGGIVGLLVLMVLMVV